MTFDQMALLLLLFIHALIKLEIILSDAFYEHLKKLRQDDDFVVKNISTLLLNRVSNVMCPNKGWITLEYYTTLIIDYFIK